MPALQVRDFPEELYEELREYAAAHHRSMAQQTIAAVDRLVHGDVFQVLSPASSRAPVSIESGDRGAKRALILERAKCRSEKLGRIPNPAELLAESRAERSQELETAVAEVWEELS